MSNQNATPDEGAKKFVISELVQEHEAFEHISDSKFTTSTDFCERVSALFSKIFSDYEGCNFGFLPGSNAPAISLYFNHKEDSSVLPCACSKEDTTQKAANATLRSTRSYNSRLINGDKYFLTDEGKALGEFVFDNFYEWKNGNRNVQWGKLVSEVADGNFAVPQQYTEVRFLDAAKLAEVIYGTYDNGTEWVYGVRIMRSIPTFTMATGMSTAGYAIAIERVSKNEVERLAKQFGLNTRAGLNIIR